MHRSLALLLAPLLVLAACTPAAVPPSRPAVPPPPEDSCGAAPYAGLVGEDATALEKVLILKPVRILRPGIAVTMDFNPARMNFDIGADGRITSIHCG